MSESSNIQRAESRATARRERAKAILRFAALVLRADTDGLDPAQTVRFLAAHLGEFCLPPEQQRIGRDITSVWKMRVFLGLESGRQRVRVTGRLGSRAALLEVRP